MSLFCLFDSGLREEVALVGSLTVVDMNCLQIQANYGRKRDRTWKEGARDARWWGEMIGKLALSVVLRLPTWLRRERVQLSGENISSHLSLSLSLWPLFFVLPFYCLLLIMTLRFYLFVHLSVWAPFVCKLFACCWLKLAGWIKCSVAHSFCELTW